MKCVVIIVNGFQPLTIITKRSILDVVAVLDPPLIKIKLICSKISSSYCICQISRADYNFPLINFCLNKKKTFDIKEKNCGNQMFLLNVQSVKPSTDKT